MNPPEAAKQVEQTLRNDAQLREAYDSFRFIGEGGTAFVWAIDRKEFRHRRVIKVLKPELGALSATTDDGEEISRELQTFFEREIHHILGISHPNVIHLYDAGHVSHEGENLWWYIMEFLENPADFDEYVKHAVASQDFHEDQFIEILLEICRGLAACHQKGVIHSDIKPGNILIAGDRQVRVTDFGFAKSVKELQRSTDRRFTLAVADRDFMCTELRAIFDAQLIKQQTLSRDVRASALYISTRQFAERGTLYDLGALGNTVRYVMEEYGLARLLPRTGKFLDSWVTRLQNATDEKKKRHTNILDAFHSLEKLRKGYSPEAISDELNPLYRHAIRLPGRIRVPLTDRMQHLVDNRVLQRLRRVRQLGLTHLIYPGATHSRFEHSLGVVDKAAHYLRALWGSEKKDFAEALSDRDIAATLVAALLHDIGHYPFAHAFEEVTPVTNRTVRHDELTREMLAGENPVLMSADGYSQLNERLWKEWKIVLADVVAVLQGIPGPNVTRELTPCLKSIINGPLDADKLDYLQRDSLHTGTPYGAAIDEGRFLQSLIAPGSGVGGTFQAIAIREKGIPAVENLYLARYHMFVTVYWHRVNRAMERMVSEAVRMLQAAPPENFQPSANFPTWFFNAGFTESDDGMLHQFFDHLARIEPSFAEELIRPLMTGIGDLRGIYQRLLTVRAFSKDDLVGPATHEHITRMFDWYLEGSVGERWKYRLFEYRIRTEILKLVGEPISHRVLLDVPDPRVETRLQFNVFEGDSSEQITDRSALYDNFIKNWKAHARRIRVFVLPRLAPALEPQLTRVKEIVADIAEKVWRSDWERDRVRLQPELETVAEFFGENLIPPRTVRRE